MMPPSSHRASVAAAGAALACLLLLSSTAVHAQQPEEQQRQAPTPVSIPLTYRSQRPLADAAPLRRHKAQAVGGEAGAAGGGHFMGIDRMHVAEGQFEVMNMYMYVYTCVCGV